MGYLPMTMLHPPSSILAIERAAASWIGTPFCENSAVKGAGVCCHMGIMEVYFEAGVVPRIPLPKGPPGWSRTHGDSLMETWLDGEGSKYFSALDSGLWTPGFGLMPGDLLGFKIGRCVHHIAILLPAGRMFHVHKAAAISPNIPTEYLCRLTRAWRPHHLIPDPSHLTPL